MKKTSLVIFLFILVIIISPLSAQTSGKIEAGVSAKLTPS